MRRCRSITDFVNAQRAAKQSGEVGGMSVLSIMATAHTVRWGALSQRLASHPQEAKQLDENGRTVLLIVISRREDDYPPPKTVQRLIEANPAAVWEGILPDLFFQDSNNNNGAVHPMPLLPRQTDNNNSPLIVAAYRKASLEILKSLTSARPSVTGDVASIVAIWNSYRELYHGSEQELISLLNDGGREAFAIFSKLHHLLSYCTKPGQIMVPWETGESLHKAAAVPKCSDHLFRVILEKFPDQIQHPDKEGRLPLHHLGMVTSEERQSKLQRLKILLEVYPEATMHRDSNGQVPLHVAITSGWEFSDFEQAIKVFPKSVRERDGISLLYPFQLAACCGLSLTSIFRLSKAAPDLIARKIPEPETARPTSTFRNSTNESHALASFTRQAAAKSQKSLTEAKPDRTDEMKALLKHVRGKNDNNLWMELQQLIKSPHAGEKHATSRWLDLHAAVALHECPIGFIRVLMHMHPEQLRQKDEHMGRTPLHYAAANAAKSLLATLPPSDNHDDEDESSARELRALRLEAVLEADPSAARIFDGSGQLPLHLAISQGMPPDCLNMLISAWPDAFCLRDGKHLLYPFLLAACRPACSLNEVFLLLLRAPHVLNASGVVA